MSKSLKLVQTLAMGQIFLTRKVGHERTIVWQLFLHHRLNPPKNELAENFLQQNYNNSLAIEFYIYVYFDKEFY